VPGTTPQKSVTRAVSPDDLSDLLLAPAHSTVAFLYERRLEASPVRLEFRDGRYIAGFAPGQPRPELDAKVALLVDDGLLSHRVTGRPGGGHC
jgi:hypothetical protein